MDKQHPCTGTRSDVGRQSCMQFASGRVRQFDIVTLVEKSSLCATMPGLTRHMAMRENIVAIGGEVSDVLARGTVNVGHEDELPQVEAAGAHCSLEARQTTGATILMPGRHPPGHRS